MFLQRIFENLRIAMAILVLFEQLQYKVNFVCFAPNSDVLNQIYHSVCLHIFDLCLLNTLDLLLMKRFEIMEKLYSSTTLLKMAGDGMHPHILPWIRPWLSPRLKMGNGNFLNLKRKKGEEALGAIPCFEVK